MKRFHNQKGDTIVETLFAMLIVSLAMLMIAGSIVTAAETNKRNKDLNNGFDTTGQEAAAFTVMLDGEAYNGPATISAYVTKEGFYYYEAEASE